jgi:hypothetical protein
MGEARALSTVALRVQRNTVALFDVPPAGDFDHELGRTPEPTEHIKLFGPRLAKYWGARPTFVDAALIDDERHREGLASHPLTELLERGRLEGARPCPVVGLGRSTEYMAAVARFVANHELLPICVRITATELESPSLAAERSALLSALGCETRRAYLVVDFGARHLDDDDLPAFSELLANRINELPALHEWLNFSVLMTGYPEKDGLRAGQSARFRRIEWVVFQALWNMGSRLLRHPTYADYALEYPGRYSTGQASPVAQLRYTTGNDTLVLKGMTTKKPNGYGVIREVAVRLSDEDAFLGPLFSRGDQFMDELARSIGRTGNASTWRWAWTDHHLTMVWRDLRILAGLSTDLVNQTEGHETEQLKLV